MQFYFLKINVKKIFFNNFYSHICNPHKGHEISLFLSKNKTNYNN